MNTRFILVMILAALAAVVAAMLVGRARAETIEQFIHRVYPNCCPHEGCRAVVVQRVGNGWLIQWTRPILYIGKIFPSPIATPIACGNEATVWCLLLPGGVS